jgi:hypothetical protein
MELTWKMLTMTDQPHLAATNGMPPPTMTIRKKNVNKVKSDFEYSDKMTTPHQVQKILHCILSKWMDHSQYVAFFDVACRNIDLATFPPGQGFLQQDL